MRKNPQVYGRDKLVEECRLLIQEYEGQPECALVMLRAAQLLELSDPTGDLAADHAGALEWYRRAAATAPPGTQPWFDAQFAVAQRMRNDVDDAAAIAQARAVLKEVSRYVERDPASAARLEVEWVRQSLVERDDSAAERHCELLLALSPEAVAIPRNQLPLDQLQADAAREFLLGLTPLEGTADDKQRRIVAFRKKHAAVARIDESAAAALAQVKSWKAGEPDFTFPDERTPAAGARSRRMVFLMLNGVAVMVGGIVWFCTANRGQRRREDGPTQT